jgi:hypothetical protein
MVNILNGPVLRTFFAAGFCFIKSSKGPDVRQILREFGIVSNSLHDTECGELQLPGDTGRKLLIS